MAEPGSPLEGMRPLLEDVSQRAARHVEQLRDRPPFPSADAVERLAELDGELPGGPHDGAATIALLDRASEAMVGSPGGRYFGFVTGGVVPAALAGSWLAAAWDQNAFSAVSSPATARIEETALRWTLDVLGLPPDTGAAFVTGTTMGHVTALAAARHALLARRGWDVEGDGLYGAPVLSVVIGEEAHATLGKALAVLGLGKNRVRAVATDGQGALRPDALGDLDALTIVWPRWGM